MVGMLAGMAAMVSESPGHEVLQAYVQHRLQLSVQRDSLDLQVELTFFEEWSEHERRRMDGNADGRVERSEVVRYVAQLAGELGECVELTAGGIALELVELHDPEVDLLGHDQVSGGHHRLRLAWFARRPTGFVPGTEVTVIDRLWPGARAIMSVQPADERSRGRLRLVTGVGMESNAALAGTSRSICWRFERSGEDEKAGRNQDKTEHENTTRGR